MNIIYKLYSMTYTINIEDLTKQLLLGEFSFSFLKNDNSIRNVKGTLNKDLIKQYSKYSNESKSSKNYKCKNLRFFDLEINEWRSINKNIKTVTLNYED